MAHLNYDNLISEPINIRKASDQEIRLLAPEVVVIYNLSAVKKIIKRGYPYKDFSKALVLFAIIYYRDSILEYFLKTLKLRTDFKVEGKPLKKFVDDRLDMFDELEDKSKYERQKKILLKIRKML